MGVDNVRTVAEGDIEEKLLTALEVNGTALAVDDRGLEEDGTTLAADSTGSEGVSSAGASGSECKPTGLSGSRRVPLLGFGVTSMESQTMLYNSVFSKRCQHNHV